MNADKTVDVLSAFIGGHLILLQLLRERCVISNTSAEGRGGGFLPAYDAFSWAKATYSA